MSDVSSLKFIDIPPIVLFSLAVGVASAFARPYFVAILLVVVTLLCIVLKMKLWGAVGGVACILLRMLLVSSYDISDEHISHHNGKYGCFLGYVGREIVAKESSVRAMVEVNYLCTPGSNKVDGEDCVSAAGKVLVWFPRYATIRYGELWHFCGVLEEPPPEVNGFPYAPYLEEKNVFSLMYRCTAENYSNRRGNAVDLLFWDIGDFLGNRIEQRLPEPHASLMSGMLFGFRSDQFPDFSQNLQRTGVTHVIAASGFNVSIVMTFINALTSFLPRKSRVAVSIVSAWAFSLIAGGSIPVIRAALMSTYSSVGSLVGFTPSARVSLMFTGALLLLVSPDYMSDISFQLSYASTAGLLYILPVLESLLNKWWRNVFENGLVTIAAMIATTPISLYHFGTFSLVSLPANMLILPLVTPSMIAGAVICVIPGGMKGVLGLISLVSWVPLDIFEKVVNWLSGVDNAMVEVGSPSFLMVLLFYCGVGLFLLWVDKWKKSTFSRFPGGNYAELLVGRACL